MKIFSFIRHVVLQLKGYFVFGHRVKILGNFTVINPSNVRIGKNYGMNHDVFILGHHCIEIGDGVVLSARVMLINSGSISIILPIKSFPPILLAL